MGCLVGMAAAGKCGVSAPEQALDQHNTGCTSDKESRSDACVSAIHRFCWSVTYPEDSGIDQFKTFGVFKEHLPGKIHISCVKAEWSGAVTLDELQKHDKHCTLEHGSQNRHCLVAVHHFCQVTLGGPWLNYAGTIQEVTDEVLKTLYVQCFKPARKEIVLHDTLKDYDDSCKSQDKIPWHRDDCYLAASKWCQSLGHSGGITQEVDETLGVTVACYDDVFSNWVYVVRSSKFYAAEKQVDIVCSLDFDIREPQDRDKIVSRTPQYLKTELYDNSGSSQTLYSSFTVSQELKEKSIFTHRRIFTISASSTANLEINAPYVTAGGSLTLSASSTKDISLTGENWRTVTYTEESRVEVAPGKSVVKEAVVTKAKLRVPWKATVITGLGYETTIDGEWQGITTYNFQVKQVECIEQLRNCPARAPNQNL